MKEVPDLEYYKIAVSFNGGPIAFMLKENTLFIEKSQGDTKNFIFIFSSYGKHITTVDLKKIIPDLRENQRWIAFNFTDDEDLFIISDDGMLFFIDPKTGELKDGKNPIDLGPSFKVNQLVDSRFDQTTNLLIMRDRAC